MAVLRSLTTTLGLNSAQFRSELRRAQSSYGAFGSAVASGAKSAGRAIGSLTSAVTSVKGALVAVGTGAALYGIKQAYVHADEIRRQGEMVGVAAGKWSAYEKAARMVGISSENVADVFKDLNVRITDAANNGSGAMVDFFDQINADAREWATLAPDEQFRRFTVELSKMSDSDARFWLDEVNDSAVQMFETLVKNDGEFLKLADQADKLGLSLTSAQFEMIGGARRELETLAATGSGVWQQVLAAAAPAITGVSKGIRQWINDQAEAAGGFRQLGVVIAETVLQAVVDTAYTLEKVLNTTYQGAEKLATMMGKTLNPERAGIERQLESVQNKIDALHTSFEQGLGDAPLMFTVPDENLAELDELQAKANELRAQLTHPFNFADSLQGQVSSIVATVKAAQVDIKSSAPVNAFGVGKVGDNTGTDEKEDLARRLDALRESYATETDLLKQKIKTEKAIIDESLAQQLADNQAAFAQRLIDEEQYLQNRAAIDSDFKALRIAAEQEYSEQLAEIERTRVEESGSLLEQLKQNIEDSAISYSDLWTNAFDSFSMGFADSVAGAIVEGESFKQSMAEVAKGFAKNMISSLVQIGTQRLALWAIEKTIGATSGSAFSTVVAGEAAAGVQLAGLNAFASTAAIPVVGPAMAPAAAAAAMAAATPFAVAANIAAATTIAGARAMGGEVLAGSTYLVGERGPELFTAGATGQITSHANLSKALNGTGNGSEAGVVVNIIDQAGVNTEVNESEDEFGRKVIDVLLMDQRNSGEVTSGYQTMWNLSRKGQF